MAKLDDENSLDERRWIPALLLAAVVIVLPTLIWLAWKALSGVDTHATKDLGRDGCQVGVESKAQLAILVDGTDSLPPNIREAFIRAADDQILNLPDGGRVTVYSLSSNESSPVVLRGSLCKVPAAKEDDRYYGVADPYAQHRHLGADLKALLEQAVSTSGATTPSPVLAALTSIAKDGHYKDRDADRRLLIVSDLLERSSRFDFYEVVPDADEVFRQSDDWGAFPDLSNVHVQVIQVSDRATNRDGQLGRAAKVFWTDAFHFANAKVEIEVVTYDERSTR